VIACKTTGCGKIQNTYIHFHFNTPAFSANSVSLWPRIIILNTRILLKSSNIRKSSKVHSHSACKLFSPFYAEILYLIWKNCMRESPLDIYKASSVNKGNFYVDSFFYVIRGRGCLKFASLTFSFTSTINFGQLFHIQN
jgi:hypothetical protein